MALRHSLFLGRMKHFLSSEFLHNKEFKFSASIIRGFKSSRSCFSNKQNAVSKNEDISLAAELLVQKDNRGINETSDFNQPVNFSELEELLSVDIQAPDLAYNNATLTPNAFGKIKELMSKAETVDFFGRPDPSIPRSAIPCSGCGAFLHCQDEAVPGYMPSQKFKMIPERKLSNEICQRCAFLRNHNIALNVSIKAEDYRLLLQQIRLIDALVIVVCDLTDLPGSILTNIGSIIGTHRPLYLVGNKVDLLPKDSAGYLKRTKQTFLRMCKDAGLITEHEIRHTCLVSAKTGYGIEELVTKLMLDWSRKGDVYVLGCTNVGKSTLFNALLSSDYCHSNARDFIERATTSVWPGTTLKTLKFPILNPIPWRLHLRAKRLLKQRPGYVEENKLRQRMYLKTGDLQYASLIGHIGQTFIGTKDRVKKGEGNIDDVSTLASYSGDNGMIAAKYENTKDSVEERLINTAGDVYSPTTFKKSKWCHDTPGVINPEQVINLLTTDELLVILTDKLMVPRTYILGPGDVMFVSGLARIDYVKGRSSMLVTVITSLSLPVHVMRLEAADSFYIANLGQKKLGVPLGNFDRVRRLPALCGKEFNIEGIGLEESGADVVLSSLGWVAVSANMGEFVTVRAYTPAGKGCCMRTPSLLPYAVLLKGKRISGTQGFECKRILATAQNDDENEQIDFRKMLIQNLQVKKGSIPVGKKYSKLEKNNVTWK